jgi:RNA recognition motif-containing protein
MERGFKTARKFRGYAFVTFENEKDAADVVQKMNGVEFQGKKLIVEYSKNKKPQARSFREDSRHRKSSRHHDSRRRRHGSRSRSRSGGRRHRRHRSSSSEPKR